MQNKKGFTLIELIVMVLILLILGTIAIMSYWKYSTYTRDAIRVTDIKTLQTSLELFQIDTGKYPKPQNSKDIVFIDAIVWTQGAVDKDILMNLGNINKIPVDPKYEVEYSYSLASNGLTYQIGSVSESSKISYSPFLENTQAATDSNVGAILVGNYNGVSTLVKLDWGYALYAIPSLMLSDINGIIDLSQMGEGLFVIPKYKCLPHSYKPFSDTCSINFIPTILFIGSNLPFTEEELAGIMEKLEEAYSNPIFDDSPYSTLKEKGDSTFIVGNILHNQIPDDDLDLWNNVMDVGLDEFLDENPGGLDDLGYNDTETELGEGIEETGITFMNVSIIDNDGNGAVCNSCIEFE